MADHQNNNDDRDGLAAEYVLGTLDAAERARVEQRLARDAGLRRAVDAWQHRLEPLLSRIGPVAPPPEIRTGILDRITAEDARDAANVIDMAGRLRRRLRLWQGAAVAAGALAAGLTLFILAGPVDRDRQAGFIAVLESPDRKPAFVAAVDLANNTIAIRRIGPAPKTGADYELWAVGGGRDKPLSLGVIDSLAQIPTDRLAGRSEAALLTTTFAVSLEPAGGSPTGQPTGPVLFTGKLLPAATGTPP